MGALTQTESRLQSCTKLYDGQTKRSDLRLGDSFFAVCSPIFGLDGTTSMGTLIGILIFLVVVFVILPALIQSEPGPLEKTYRSIEEGVRRSEEDRLLRAFRRVDPNWTGCRFCFGTAIGELRDGATVPCPDCNGLCC